MPSVDAAARWSRLPFSGAVHGRDRYSLMLAVPRGCRRPNGMKSNFFFFKPYAAALASPFSLLPLSLAGAAKGRALPTELAAAEAIAGQSIDLGSINPNSQNYPKSIL
ncbi:hypothetical protein L484_022805 [Morus notabilis]|uniref:Uncharacterized protein n=1 Tax=Morus notabilis TaxID=981085 RepID=W9SFQ5_9ROSA|nr:hypothetical protein L484_022805 [Morus notabilis]